MGGEVVVVVDTCVCHQLLLLLCGGADSGQLCYVFLFIAAALVLVLCGFVMMTICCGDGECCWLVSSIAFGECGGMVVLSLGVAY